MKTLMIAVILASAGMQILADPPAQPAVQYGPKSALEKLELIVSVSEYWKKSGLSKQLPCGEFVAGQFLTVKPNRHKAERVCTGILPLIQNGKAIPAPAIAYLDDSTTPATVVHVQIVELDF